MDTFEEYPGVGVVFVGLCLLAQLLTGKLNSRSYHILSRRWLLCKVKILGHGISSSITLFLLSRSHGVFLCQLGPFAIVCTRSASSCSMPSILVLS